MSDTDLQVALMEAGRMNLMHLPPGAIAWLWDRPPAQVDSAEALATAANAYGNPIVDASLLKADQNVMLIKCQGGECFRIYPDGGFSYEDTPMDIGGCSSVLQGYQCPQGNVDELGHSAMADTAQELQQDTAELGYEIDSMVMDDMGNDEHLDAMPPEAGVPSPEGMTNMAGEPTMDEDSTGGLTGNAAGAGMGTGSPYVGQMPMASEQLDNLMQARELGEFRIRDLDEDDVDYMAESLGLAEADPLERDRAGQYRHKFDRMCVCGHTNGEHTAERVKVDGQWYQECMAETPSPTGFGDPCECQVFTPVKKPRRRVKEYEMAVEAFLYTAPTVSLGMLNESTGLYELNLGAFGKAVQQKVSQGVDAIQKGVSGGQGSVGDLTTNLFTRASNAIRDNKITGKLEQLVKQNPKMALFATAVLAVIGTTALQGLDVSDLTSAVDQLVQGTQIDDQAADALQNVHDAGVTDVATMVDKLDQQTYQSMVSDLQAVNVSKEALNQALNLIQKATGQYPTGIDALLDAADTAARAYVDGDVQMTGGKGWSEDSMTRQAADFLSRFADQIEGYS